MRNLKAKKPNKIQILGGMPTLKRKWQSQSQNKKKVPHQNNYKKKANQRNTTRKNWNIRWVKQMVVLTLSLYKPKTFFESMNLLLI
jgi:hypothetical protein